MNFNKFFDIIYWELNVYMLQPNIFINLKEIKKVCKYWNLYWHYDKIIRFDISNNVVKIDRYVDKIIKFIGCLNNVKYFNHSGNNFMCTDFPILENILYLICKNTIISYIPSELYNLKKLNCSYCDNIKTIPKINSLEELNCSNTMIKIIPEELNSLEKLNCSYCKKIKTIPKIISLKKLICIKTKITEIPLCLINLKKLDCSYCKNIIKLPKIGSIKNLNCCFTNIKKISKKMNKLEKLRCYYCENLQSIPIIMSIKKIYCEKIKNLNMEKLFVDLEKINNNIEYIDCTSYHKSYDILKKCIIENYKLSYNKCLDMRNKKTYELYSIIKNKYIDEKILVEIFLRNLISCDTIFLDFVPDDMLTDEFCCNVISEYDEHGAYTNVIFKAISKRKLTEKICESATLNCDHHCADKILKLIPKKLLNVKMVSNLFFNINLVDLFNYIPEELYNEELAIELLKYSKCKYCDEKANIVKILQNFPKNINDIYKSEINKIKNRLNGKIEKRKMCRKDHFILIIKI